MTRAANFPSKKSARIMACLALLPCSGLAACNSTEKVAVPVASVEVTPAERTSVSQVVTADAVVFPLMQSTISPKITSTIAEFKVQRGSRVKKGQLLAVLENKDLAAQALASKGDFEQADANYVIAMNAGLPQQLQKAELDAAAAKSAFDAAQKVYDSRKDLFQQGAIPRRDLDAADVALALARSQNEQAQKQLADLKRLGNEQLMKAAQGTKQLAEGHYRAAAAQLSYSEIRSPIDGVVTDRPLYVGDLATANQPILTVMDTSTLVAKAHIPQAEAILLKVGDAAEIKVNDLDSIKGRVSLVSPALDPGSTTVEIWIEAHKPNPALKPGMSVGIVMAAKTVKDAIAVPTAAVFKNDDGSYYVLLAGADKKAHKKVVQIGVKNTELTQIAGGIDAGVPVITSGGYAVPDGAAIEIKETSVPEKGEVEAPTDKSSAQKKKTTAAGKAQE